MNSGHEHSCNTFRWWPAGNPFFPIHWLAELFLVQDTGTKDATGKDVVNVFGGLTWGWQVTRS